MTKKEQLEFGIATDLLLILRDESQFEAINDLQKVIEKLYFADVLRQTRKREKANKLLSTQEKK